MLPRLLHRTPARRQLGLGAAAACPRRLLAQLKNPASPPKGKRKPTIKPILGSNKWTVDDNLTRSNKCDPYEQGGKPLEEALVRELLARDLPQWELVEVTRHSTRLPAATRDLCELPR